MSFPAFVTPFPAGGRDVRLGQKTQFLASNSPPCREAAGAELPARAPGRACRFFSMAQSVSGCPGHEVPMAVDTQGRHTGFGGTRVLRVSFRWAVLSAQRRSPRGSVGAKPLAFDPGGNRHGEWTGAHGAAQCRQGSLSSGPAAMAAVWTGCLRLHELSLCSGRLCLWLSCDWQWARGLEAGWPRARLHPPPAGSTDLGSEGAVRM